MISAKDIIAKYTISRKISNGRKEGEIKVTEGYLNDDIKAMMKEYALQVVDTMKNITMSTGPTHITYRKIEELKKKIENE